jgi:cytochrome c biogenesis protein CcmG/thiol:disulfide interchange protein DsbE
VILVGVVVVTVVAAVLAALLASDDEDDQGSRPAAQVSVAGVAEVGDQAPDFEVPALDGDGQVRLSDFRGTPVVLNFWASWCNPCREEFPVLRRAAEKYGGDVAIVGVTYKDIPSDSRAFARKEKADWALGEDDRGTVGAEEYGVRALPQTFFIDADGRIVDRVFGITSDAALRGPLERLLRQRTQPTR